MIKKPSVSKTKTPPNKKNISPSISKAQNGKLTNDELKSLSHQKRGKGALSDAESFVKKRGGIKNEVGFLTPSQTKQLKEYMDKAGLPQKIFEGLPNIGVLFGNSAADIPKGSQLEKQKQGGIIKKKMK